MELLRSFCGFQQNPSNLFRTTHEHLIEISFKSLKSDPCIYTYSDDGVVIFLTLFIDAPPKAPSTHCSITYTSGVGAEISLKYSDDELLNKEQQQRFQAFTGYVPSVGQMTRHYTLYALNQLVRTKSKLSEAHMAAAKHLLRYLAMVMYPAPTYKQGRFKLTAFSDAN